MRIMETKVWSFNELSDDAKEKAIANFRENNLGYEWWDCVYNDAKMIGALMGIDIDKIFFSGFASQGDGACFEGDYEYKKGSLKAVKEYAPKDTDLHDVAQRLFLAQKPAFYQLTASVKHRGHYSHENCTDITVSDKDDFTVSQDQDEEVREALRAFMQWIYTRLEAEYDYLQSDEVIIESIDANGYEFTANGKMV